MVPMAMLQIRATWSLGVYAAMINFAFLVYQPPLMFASTAFLYFKNNSKMEINNKNKILALAWLIMVRAFQRCVIFSVFLSSCCLSHCNSFPHSPWQLELRGKAMQVNANCDAARSPSGRPGEMTDDDGGDGGKQNARRQTNTISSALIPVSNHCQNVYIVGGAWEQCF